MKKIKLREDLNFVKQEVSPDVEKAAKKKKLQNVGWGKYEDPKAQQITHVASQDKLVPYKKALKSNSYQQANADNVGDLGATMLPDVQELSQVLTQAYSADHYDDQELDAIYYYTDTGYADINERLASLPTGVPANKIEPNAPDDRMPDIIASLDSALKKSRAPQDFMVYMSLGDGHDMMKYVPGATFKFKGFKSASIDITSVTNIADKDNVGAAGRPQLVVLQIQVKKNSKGMYLADYSPTPDEGEFLFPRGAAITIVDGPSKLVGSDAVSGIMNLEIVYFDCTMKA